MKPDVVWSVAETGYGESVYVIATDVVAVLSAPALALRLTDVPKAALAARLKLEHFRKLALAGEGRD